MYKFSIGLDLLGTYFKAFWDIARVLAWLDCLYIPVAAKSLQICFYFFVLNYFHWLVLFVTTLYYFSINENNIYLKTVYVILMLIILRVYNKISFWGQSSLWRTVINWFQQDQSWRVTTPLLFSAKPSSQKNSQLPSIFLARVGSLPWFKQKAHKLYQTCFACYQFLLSPFLRIFELVKSDYYVELRNKMSIMCNNDKVLFNFFFEEI